MYDSDWLEKALTLSLIGYTSTRETALRHSDWLYRLFSHVKIKRTDFCKWALWTKIRVLRVINRFVARVAPFVDLQMQQYQILSNLNNFSVIM